MKQSPRKKNILFFPVLLVGGLSVCFYFYSENKRHQENTSILNNLNFQAMNENLPRLRIDDAKIGSGLEVARGSHVKIQYTAHLESDSKIIDSTLDRGPLEFIVGEKQTIQGLDLGILGMKPGGRRTITIPARMAYGERGAGGGLIPPDSTLVYEVELLH